MKIYVVKDTKIGFTNSIFLKPSDELAIRDFTLLANMPDTSVSQFPADFELFCLGDYNAYNGIISSDVRFVATALELVGKIRVPSNLYDDLKAASVKSDEVKSDEV